MKKLIFSIFVGLFLTLEGEELSSFVASVRESLSEIEPDQVERLLRIAWR